jgi:undecaprenyl-diphosphatase
MSKKIAILISAIVFFLLILSGIEMHNSIIVLLDAKAASLALSIRNPFLGNIMVFATNTGGTIGSLIIFIIFSAVLFLKKQKKWLYVFASSFFLSVISETAIKHLVGRMRPINQYLITETDFSFPSGHSIAATVFLISSILFIAPIIKNKVLKNIFILLACILFPLVALSRIYLSVHYASDVLGSIFLGIACFILVEYLVKKTLPEGEKNAINTK